ncbi:MAG: DUF1214 domain-containing protein [Microthrixaceae bacterium]|nr:DUF1214 domain-containing protein [Microthrixaceae bacterium]
MPIEQTWTALVESLRQAGEKVAANTADLDDAERADGYRALLRAFNNQLGRFEVDLERPELVPFNGWRQKFFMDNPDFRYWVADVRDDRRYRITGTVGDAVYQSITAYSGIPLAAKAAGRIDSDTINVDADGRFEVIVSQEQPESGDWLQMEEGANVVWVRHFHDDVAHDQLGTASIEPLDPPSTPAEFDTADLEERIGRLGFLMNFVPDVWASSLNEEIERPNELRHWAEMAGGAVYTEPGIHYVRGSWQLEADEALVIEGSVVPCRYWNILLYSRFLNSLDYRSRQVSRTSGNSRINGDRFSFVISARDPGGAHDWLDTEGRDFGLVVMRWLQPQGDVPLPEVRRCSIAELKG